MAVGNLCAAAGIRHDQRQAARHRFGRDQPERLRFGAVDQRVAARDDAREAFAVIDRAEHADMRRTRDTRLDLAAFDAGAEQDQPDRQIRTGALDRVNHQSPAFFGMMAAQPQQ
ncbi:hypothetical protein D9M73_118650 [compost metagenome]